MLATTAGWLGKHEVVDVRFDPRVLPFARLLEFAQQTGCDRLVWTTSASQQEHAAAVLGERARPLGEAPRPDREPKYYLLQQLLRHVPMTEMQAARTNALLAPSRKGYAVTGGLAGEDRLRFLSPGQRQLVKVVGRDVGEHWPVLVDRPFLEAWAAFERVRAARQR